MYFKKKVAYISDGANWVIREIGLSLKKNLKDIHFDFQKSGLFVRGVCHYSGRYLIRRLAVKGPFSRNIITYFHGEDTDYDLLKAFRKNQRNIDFIHTSCQKTKEHLVRNGIVEQKIVIIPIGIEISKFQAATPKEKLRIRQELGIPEDAFVVGSFQKDGNGWGEGNEPKLIKGPDLFCDTMEIIKDKVPLYVFLSGPSRGYVKNRLEKSKIPFRHEYLENYDQVPRLFKAIDAYLVSSRLEGGPRAPMEAQASGVPIVSTDVGQVDQVIQNKFNGIVVDIENIHQMANGLMKIYQDEDFRNKMIENGLQSVKRFDYTLIAQDYLEKLYKPLL